MIVPLIRNPFKKILLYLLLFDTEIIWRIHYIIWRIHNIYLENTISWLFPPLFSTQMKINQTDFEVPPTAVVDGDQSNCEETTNTLNLAWKEVAKNDTATMLNRKIIITFQKAQNTTSPM